MSRKERKYKRQFSPDSVYQKVSITRFINIVMLQGKKSLAERIVYDALEELAKAVSESPLEAFQKSLDNVRPLMEVKSRRVGGSTYQVPIEVARDRGVSLAMKWIVGCARKGSGGRSMTDRLSKELIDAFNSEGSSVKKKVDTHKMAEANKAFSHYRF